ncbi:MAG: hypothetical protein WCB70_16055 [Xanthobacteraceae bacterium]
MPLYGRRLHLTLLWRRWRRLHLTLLGRWLHLTLLWRRRWLAWPLWLFLFLLITLGCLRYHEHAIERPGVH